MKIVQNIFVAVLAGGLSSRMGRDKRFLKYSGEFLIDHALNLAKEVTDCERVFLCGDVPNRKCLVDQNPFIGPLAGVQTAMDKVSFDGWLVVIPVDMPLLNFDVLRNLIEKSQIISDYDLFRYSNFEMPFIVRKNALTQAVLMNCIHEGIPSNRSLRKFQESLKTYYTNLDLKFIKMMCNTNTPFDWENLNMESFV